MFPLTAWTPEPAAGGRDAPPVSLRFIRFPVTTLRKQTVRYNLFLPAFLCFYQFVAFLSVACPVRQLQVFYIRWMPAPVNRNNMINTCTQWIRISKGFVHRFSTDSAAVLCRQNPFLVFLKRKAMAPVMIWPESFLLHLFSPFLYEKKETAAY